MNSSRRKTDSLIIGDEENLHPNHHRRSIAKSTNARQDVVQPSKSKAAVTTAANQASPLNFCNGTTLHNVVFLFLLKAVIITLLINFHLVTVLSGLRPDATISYTTNDHTTPPTPPISTIPEASAVVTMVRRSFGTTLPTTTLSAASGVLTISTMAAATTIKRIIIGAMATVPTRRIATAEIATIGAGVTAIPRSMVATNAPPRAAIGRAIAVVPM